MIENQELPPKRQNTLSKGFRLLIDKLGISGDQEDGKKLETIEKLDIFKRAKVQFDALFYLDPNLKEVRNRKIIIETANELVKNGFLDAAEFSDLENADVQELRGIMDFSEKLLSRELNKEVGLPYFPAMQIAEQKNILSDVLDNLSNINFEIDETKGSHTFGRMLRKLVEASAISRNEIIENNLAWDAKKIKNYNAATKQDIETLKGLLNIKLAQLEF